MIIYFTGKTFQHVIREVIEKNDELAFDTEPSNELDFLKTIKQNIIQYESVDTMIVDISVCQNTEKELLDALEMIRSMYDGMKIIIFAPYREEGDDFLTKCFNMGILNIIISDDFLEIKQELEKCIVKGMTYREAARFKESKQEKVVVKHEIKRIVNKRMIGIAGVESNIGVTHNAIVLANFFRKQGFMVALVEMNDSGAFDAICRDFGEKKFQEGYFTLNGIDFYANYTAEKVAEVLEHSYNVILFDMGVYQECDRMLFERCEDRIIIASAKPWEMDAANTIFDLASKEALGKYVFCFNFTPQTDYAAIREGMGEVTENVHFLKYTVQPFDNYDFADAEEIFSDCLPEKIQEEKHGFLARFKKRKE